MRKHDPDCWVLTFRRADAGDPAANPAQIDALPRPMDGATRRWICDGIESDLGVPAGSVTLHPWPDFCPGCEFCRPRGKADAAA